MLCAKYILTYTFCPSIADICMKKKNATRPLLFLSFLSQSALLNRSHHHPHHSTTQYSTQQLVTLTQYTHCSQISTHTLAISLNTKSSMNVYADAPMYTWIEANRRVCGKKEHATENERENGVWYIILFFFEK